MADRLLITGVAGACGAALCCVTPLLPWAFSALGIGGLLGYVYRDDVLIPLAVAFLGLVGYALWRRNKTSS